MANIKTTQQQALEQSELWKLHEAIDDFVADMDALAKHAEFVQISAMQSTAARLLNLSREANAEFYRSQTAHFIAA